MADIDKQTNASKTQNKSLLKKQDKNKTDKKIKKQEVNASDTKKEPNININVLGVKEQPKQDKGKEPEVYGCKWLSFISFKNNKVSFICDMIAIAMALLLIATLFIPEFVFGIKTTHGTESSSWSCLNLIANGATGNLLTVCILSIIIAGCGLLLLAGMIVKTFLNDKKAWLDLTIMILSLIILILTIITFVLCFNVDYVTGINYYHSAKITVSYAMITALIAGIITCGRYAFCVKFGK